MVFDVNEWTNQGRAALSELRSKREELLDKIGSLDKEITSIEKTLGIERSDARKVRFKYKIKKYIADNDLQEVAVDDLVALWPNVSGVRAPLVASLKRFCRTEGYHLEDDVLIQNDDVE